MSWLKGRWLKKRQITPSDFENLLQEGRIIALRADAAWNGRANWAGFILQALDWELTDYLLKLGNPLGFTGLGKTQLHPMLQFDLDEPNSSADGDGAGTPWHEVVKGLTKHGSTMDAGEIYWRSKTGQFGEEFANYLSSRSTAFRRLKKVLEIYDAVRGERYKCSGRRHLVQAISSLTDTQRRCFGLWADGMKPKAIADALALPSEAAVADILAAAEEQLRAWFKERNIEWAALGVMPDTPARLATASGKPQAEQAARGGTRQLSGAHDPEAEELRPDQQALLRKIEERVREEGTE
jgi:hypothetical protein